MQGGGPQQAAAVHAAAEHARRPAALPGQNLCVCVSHLGLLDYGKKIIISIILVNIEITIIQTIIFEKI